MSESKTLKTRLALLYKTYAEWEAVKDTFIPLKGEVCFCDIAAESSIVANEPCLLFKVGNGISTFAQLDWAAAPAADVYSWAKQENLDFDTLSEEFKSKLIEYTKMNGFQYRILNDGVEGYWRLVRTGTNWATSETVSEFSVQFLITDVQELKTSVENLSTSISTLTTNLNAEIAERKLEDERETNARTAADAVLETEVQQAYVQGSVYFLEAKDYGFEASIKQNQVVNNDCLIDLVTRYALTDSRKVAVISGSTVYYVIQVTDTTGDDNAAPGFVCAGGAVLSDDGFIESYNELIVFIYDKVSGNSYNFYHNSIENIKNIDSDVKIKLSTNLTFDNIRYDASQNDFRIYIPETAYTDVEHTEGTDVLYGTLQFYSNDSTISHYRIGTIDDFGNPDLVALSTDSVGRKYAQYTNLVVANWDSENNKWVPISSLTTDKYYPNTGLLLELYAGSTLDDYKYSFSRRISFSDLAHFHTNKDWYAVENQETAVDEASIVYNAQRLAIKGYAAAAQGYVPAKDVNTGITWVKPLSDEQLADAVNRANQAATLSGNYSVTSGTYAGNSATSATESANSALQAARSVTQIQEYIENKFWQGSMTEYDALEEISEGTFYFIRM